MPAHAPAVALLLLVLALLSAPLPAQELALPAERPDEEEQRRDRLRVEVRHHGVYASCALTGEGRDRATSFDTSAYEAGLFRSVALTHDTLISPVSRYPMATSAALTTATSIEATALCSASTTAGLSVRLYTGGDTDYDLSRPSSPSSRTARVFGVMMPAGSWNGRIPGLPALPGGPAPSFDAALWNARVAGRSANGSWRAEVGSLYPGMGAGYNKYLNMEHFLFRTPVSQMSLFGHWKRADRVYSESLPLERMPGLGARLSGEAGDMNYELFSLRNDETPITVNRAYTYSGARLGYRSGGVRLAASTLSSTLDKVRASEDPAVPGRRFETLAGIDFEYDLSPCLGIYGAFASSRYNEDGGRNTLVFHGNASLLGLRGSFAGDRLRVDLRRQYLDPDFEPIGHHKRAVYPQGYEGMRGELKYSWGTPAERGKEGNALGLHLCRYEQVDGDVGLLQGSGVYALEDYVFPDGTAPGRSNPSRGRIEIFSPELDLRFRGLPFHFGGYYEDLRFSRGADALGRSYDKRVANLSLWADIELGGELEIVAGFRSVDFQGAWFLGDTSYAFRQRGTIGKIGLSYSNHRDCKVSATVHRYGYVDTSPINTGLGGNPGANDWEGTLLLIETTLRF